MKRIILLLCCLSVSVIAPVTNAHAASAYRVAFVADNDILSVRSGPGVEFDEVGQLPYNASDVVVTGAAQSASDGGTWVPVQWNAISGWVNRYFLTEQVDGDQFCGDLYAYSQVFNLLSAVRGRVGEAFGMMTGSSRGLLLRRHRWDTEVRLMPAEVTQMFSDATVRDWGVGQGSGEPIRGTFAEVMLPLLDRDMLSASRIACNVLLGGGTTGLLTLPAEYQQLNFISVYRPGVSGDELNWGSWAIGIEYWDGIPVIAFLVHYEWEI
ncbi:MAG: hypothetical protein U0528_13895 [Anaerolineae bacterium]